MLVEHNILPSVVYSSLLRRAIRTANIALNKADRHWIPVIRDWRLNERHYGALQGLNKAETKDKYGDEQFMEWQIGRASCRERGWNAEGEGAVEAEGVEME